MKSNLNSRTSKINSGIILSIIGGLTSISIAFVLTDITPNLAAGLDGLFIIIQGITIIGGIITLIGTAVALVNTKIGFLIILISGIIAGGNILTIIGAIMVRKKGKKAKQENKLRYNDVVYKFLREKQDAFTIRALQTRLDNTISNHNEKEYIRKNLQNILDKMNQARIK